MKHTIGKLTKTFLLAALTVAALSAFACAADGLATGFATTTASSLNLRVGGSMDAAVLTRLDKGVPVAILDHADPEWCHVRCDGKEGYISAQYLAVDEDNVFEIWGRVNGSVVNIRQSPTTDSGVVTKLSSGKAVAVTGLVDGWFSLSLSNGAVGYIRSDLLNLVKDASAPVAAASTNSAPPPSAEGCSVTEYAAKFLGTRYVYGGASPSGFDCSGFTMYVYRQFGVSLSHTASGQWTSGKGAKVSRADLAPGDLVFFNDPSRSHGKSCSHVGIYVGNGQFIHASSSKSNGVIYSSLNDSYYSKYYVGGLRIL